MRQFQSPSFVFLMACLISILAISGFCGAQSDPLTPQLSEGESFYQPSSGGESSAEPEWVTEGRASVQNLEIDSSARMADEAKKHDLENPPMKYRWWNYPIYGVLGMPRDLVDGFFGVASMVPFINYITTGAMYEIVPTQMLARNWNDWHPWPLYKKINKNGHGWLDGKWGYFSNLHHTTFKTVDEEKLEQWRIQNQAMDVQAFGTKQKTDEQIRQIVGQRTQYLRDTRALFDQGQYRAVIQRMVAYREIDPLNNDARAMLAAALIADLPNIAERKWADQTLVDLLWGSSRAVLLPVREELEDSTGTLATSDDTARYLVAVNMRLGNFGQALSAAQELVDANPGNVTYLRLRYEVALAGGEPEQIEEAAKAIEQAAGAGSVAAQHARGRQALAAKQPLQAIEVYERLVKAEPDNARFHYLLGMAYVQRGQDTKDLQSKRSAVRALDYAAERANSDEEKEFYQWVRKAAQEMPGQR